MINLSLTVEQVNLILAALGQRPYVDVADLIHRIKIDAEEQLANFAKVNEPEPPSE
jgi:hypothetical protein